MTMAAMTSGKAEVPLICSAKACPCSFAQTVRTSSSDCEPLGTMLSSEACA